MKVTFDNIFGPILQLSYWPCQNMGKNVGPFYFSSIKCNIPISILYLMRPLEVCVMSVGLCVCPQLQWETLRFSSPSLYYISQVFLVEDYDFCRFYFS